MHVLLIHQYFNTHDQAGGTRHYELTRYLTDRDFRVSVIGSSQNYLSLQAEVAGESKEVVDGIEIRRIRVPTARRNTFLHWLRGFLSFTVSAVRVGLKVPAVDLVWGTSPPIFQATGAYVLSLLRRKPFLLEVRDLWPDNLVELGMVRNRFAIAFSRWLESRLYSGANIIMANSPGFIEHIASKGVDREKIHLLPNGVDVDGFDPEADGRAFREEWNLEDAFVAMYTGAHGPANDLGVLLEAAALLRDRQDIRVVLVGDGRDKQRLVDRADQLKLTNVVFVPPQPKSRMAEVLGAADAGVAILRPLPLFKAVYPNKVFDYMAAGKPTILAIDGVIREVVESAGGGSFVPPGDPAELARTIAAYNEDEERQRKEGRRARAYVERHFDRDDHARKLAALLENFLT